METIETQHYIVTGILRKGISILAKKRHDYATTEDAFSNFRFTGMCLDFAIGAGLRGPSLAFLALITTKLARLISLLGKEEEAENEALVDTFVDLANYAALWGGCVLSDTIERGD